MKVAKNHVGLKYGKLTVLSQWRGECYRQYGSCLCECGNEKVIRLSHLPYGKIVSCGCVAIEKIRKLNLSHGEAHKSREWQTWMSMKQRCYDIKIPNYKDYGGRGIKVCDRWLNSFEAFLNDMGRRPSGLSIDRIDNNGNYEPSNCKWSTRKEQANNRRKILKTKKSISEWGDYLQMSKKVIRNRLKYGWPIESVLHKYRYNRWHKPLVS